MNRLEEINSKLISFTFKKSVGGLKNKIKDEVSKLASENLTKLNEFIK